MNFTEEEILEAILYNEIQKELNKDIIKCMIDPNHKMESVPATYENESVKKEHIRIMKERDKIMQERIKQLKLND